MKQLNNFISDFFEFIKLSTSPYHVIQTSTKILEEMGFVQLDFKSSWDLRPNTKYYTVPYGTSLFAFQTGKEISKKTSFRIIASHTDHPGFRIKPNPSISEKGYIKLNTEPYGGAILSTWLDRPLSIAGKIVLRSQDVFNPTIQFIDYEEPLLSIPNLAIHMNRKLNSGYELNKQKDLLPLLSNKTNSSANNDAFMEFLSELLHVNIDDILDYDLSVYNTENPCLFGLNKEFISAPRIDNLSSVYAMLESITTAPAHEDKILLAAFYDNEEIGSNTKQGADSHLTQILLEKIFDGLNLTREDLNNSIMNSFLLSADVAHGFHPNYGEKNDPTNITTLNEGIVIKINSNQRYATDTEAISILQQLCDAYQIPYQKFVNRSDMAGGSTLGTIISSWLPMHTVDLGIPVLAMHSARETAGIKDEYSLFQLCYNFYSHHHKTTK
ncbi:MAG: M18 family aminopeptidase [Lachnospiraceae bacterium]|nr:M18 family aminopeptidase [Lachnospiraceae bacterium]